MTLAELLKLYAPEVNENQCKLLTRKLEEWCDEYHETHAHKAMDGWCCACSFDRALMNREIEGAKANRNHLL